MVTDSKVFVILSFKPAQQGTGKAPGGGGPGTLGCLLLYSEGRSLPYRIGSTWPRKFDLPRGADFDC